MITLTINSFGVLKNHFPPKLELEFAQALSVNELFEVLTNQFEGTHQALSSTRVAINEELVSKDTMIINSTEIFLLPPSSGG